MRVVLDTSYALRGPSGTATYIERLVPELEALGVEVVPAAHSTRGAPGGGVVRSVRNLAADVAWRRHALARLARESNADLVHHPLPAHARAISAPQVITVHDLAFEAHPDAFPPAFRTYTRRAHRRAARHAAAVICVSEATATEVRARWGVEPARLRVARHGPGQAPVAVDPRPEPRHFLYIGDDEPRKDLALLREAHARYARDAGTAALPLVIAGAAGRAFTPAELADLLAGAAALVHPARHEGFGLTVLEAMHAGTPVIAVRNPATAEVSGTAAQLVDGLDGLVRAMARLATDPPARGALSAAGRARAERFSWGAAARAHVEAYTFALA